MNTPAGDMIMDTGSGLFLIWSSGSRCLLIKFLPGFNWQNHRQANRLRRQDNIQIGAGDLREKTHTEINFALTPGGIKTYRRHSGGKPEITFLIISEVDFPLTSGIATTFPPCEVTVSLPII